MKSGFLPTHRESVGGGMGKRETQKAHGLIGKTDSPSPQPTEQLEQFVA
jgi:hypothetical protein